MLGLKSGTVALSEPDPVWAEAYERERERVNNAVGSYLVAIEHVGSTAVPGLRAKPIVDIAAATPSFEAFFAAVPEVEKLGYVFKGEFGIPRRHFFTLGEPTTIHLHIFEQASQDWREQLAFRNAMRGSAELRAAYEALKVELAAKFADNRQAYTEAKAEFIQRVLREGQAAPSA